MLLYIEDFSLEKFYIFDSPTFWNKFTRQQHSLEDVTNLEEEREWENATRLEYKLRYTKAVWEKEPNRKQEEVKNATLEKRTNQIISVLHFEGYNAFPS